MDSSKCLTEDEIFVLLNNFRPDIDVSDLESEHNDCDIAVMKIVTLR